MKKILLLVLLLLIASSITVQAQSEPLLPPLAKAKNKKVPAQKGKKCEESTIIISSVDIEANLEIFEKIKKCVEEDGHVTAYVYGQGGPADEALAFFDLMRTSGISKHTTFVATSIVWSASNIVWLSAETRIVLPGSQFIIHGATLNMNNESKEIRNESADNSFRLTTEAVRISAGEKGAGFWEKSISHYHPGSAFDAQKALEYGWATEILPYQSYP